MIMLLLDASVWCTKHRYHFLATILLFLSTGSVKAQMQEQHSIFAATSPTTFGWYKIVPGFGVVRTVEGGVITFEADSAEVATVSRILDSLNNHTTSINSKLSLSGFTKAAMIALGMMAYTDTAAALNPYLRKTDTTGKWLPKVNVITAGSYGVVTVNSNGLATSGKRQETYSGTTNASGNYTVTYSVAYSVTPNVQFQINGGTVTQNALLTSSTTTGFTVNVKNRTDALGLLPTYANVNGAAVDVLVIEK